MARRCESGSIGGISFGERPLFDAGAVRRRAAELCQVNEVPSMHDISSPSNNRWSGRRPVASFGATRGRGMWIKCLRLAPPLPLAAQLRR